MPRHRLTAMPAAVTTHARAGTLADSLMSSLRKSRQHNKETRFLASNPGFLLAAEKKPGFRGRNRVSDRGLTPAADGGNCYCSPVAFPPAGRPAFEDLPMRARLRGPTALALLAALAAVPASAEETWWSFKPLARPAVPEGR